MERKSLNKNDYEFLKREIIFQMESGNIGKEQADNILQGYEIKEQMSFIKVLVTIGSILIGLGILSFIASNWVYLGKPIKLLLIFFSYLLVQFFGYRMEELYPKTSRSLNYLAVLIFGAGIFLIGQMFHFGGKFTNAFLIWGLGIFPLAIILKDKIIFSFLQLTLFVYLNGQFFYDKVPFMLFVLIPLLYITQRLVQSNINLFITNLLSLNFIMYLLIELVDVELIILIVLFFMIGVIFYFSPFSYQKELFQLQGILLSGITGLILTYKSIWFGLSIENDIFITVIYSIFVVIFVLLLLYLIKQKKILALFFLGITILRYYVDTMYDFLPKSILFFSTGLLLLGFGYYFERIRRKEKMK